MAAGLRTCYSHLQERAAAERRAGDAAEAEMQRAAADLAQTRKSQRESDRQSVIALARELGERGMPGAMSLRKRAWPGWKVKIYPVGTRLQKTGSGNGHWGDQGSTTYEDEIYVSATGDFFFRRPSQKRLDGPLPVDSLDYMKYIPDGYRSDFDFAEGLRLLRQFGSAEERDGRT